MTVTPKRTIALGFSAVGFSILLAACDGATEPRIPTRLEAVTPLYFTAIVASEVSPAPAVRVTDQDGSPVQGAPVLFGASIEGNVSVNTSILTDANGTAKLGAWRLHKRAGNQTLTAQMAGNLPPVVFTAVALPAPAAMIDALDSTVVVPAGGMISLRVRVADTFGNPIEAALVTFEVESGGGSLALSSASTDAAGIARNVWTVGPGQNVVAASSTGLAHVRFSATLVAGAVVYQLDSTPVWAPAWIALGDDNRFTTSVRGINGTGTYTVSGNSMLFTYSNDFLLKLGEELDVWAYPYSLQQEGGSVAPGRITIRRCWSEDCYENDWIFKNMSP